MTEMLQSERVKAVRDDIADSFGEWIPSVSPQGKDQIVIYLNVDGAVRSYEITVRERFC